VQNAQQSQEIITTRIMYDALSIPFAGRNHVAAAVKIALPAHKLAAVKVMFYGHTA